MSAPGPGPRGAGGPGTGGAGPAGRARALAPWAVLAVGLAAVYAPVLRSSALFNDDYVNLVEAPPAAWIVGAAGRPVQYLVTEWAHRLLVGTGDVLPLRLAGFALSLALAAALVAAVRRGLGTWGAVALVLFVSSVPAWLVTFGWLSLVMNLPGFLAAAAAYATGYLLLGEARTRGARVALGALTVALVAFASLSYQIAAGLPVALVVYHLLFERDRGAPVRRAVVAYALVAAGLVLSLVTLKLVLAATGIPLADRAEGALARLGSLRGLLLPLRIFDENFALHYYWWGWLTREAAVVVGLAVTALVVRVAWRETRPAEPQGREDRARWLLVLAGFAGAGLLFAIDASRELRSKPFLTLLVLFVAVYALRATRSWARLPARPAVVAAVVALTMWSGRSTLAGGLVEYAERELAEVRSALALQSPVEHVHVLQPENHCFTAPCYGWFEFNLKLASSQDWVPRGLVRYALMQLGRGGEPARITFSRGRPSEEATLIIDLRRLEQSLRAERGEVVDLEQFLKRKDVAGQDVRGLSGLWLELKPRLTTLSAPKGKGLGPGAGRAPAAPAGHPPAPAAGRPH